MARIVPSSSLRRKRKLSPLSLYSSKLAAGAPFVLSLSLSLSFCAALSLSFCWAAPKCGPATSPRRPARASIRAVFRMTCFMSITLPRMFAGQRSGRLVNGGRHPRPGTVRAEAEQARGRRLATFGKLPKAGTALLFAGDRVDSPIYSETYGESPGEGGRLAEK